MSKEETIELSVRVPKNIMDFFRAYWKFVGYTDQTPEEYLAQYTSKNLPELIFDVVFECIMDDANQIIGTYGLEAYRDLIGVHAPKVKNDC